MPAGAKLILRFEPFLLHAECLDLEAAQALLQAARLAGFRESGATIGSSGGRVMVGACTCVRVSICECVSVCECVGVHARVRGACVCVCLGF